MMTLGALFGDCDRQLVFHKSISSQYSIATGREPSFLVRDNFTRNGNITHNKYTITMQYSRDYLEFRHVCTRNADPCSIETIVLHNLLGQYHFPIT